MTEKCKDCGQTVQMLKPNQYRKREKYHIKGILATKGCKEKLRKTIFSSSPLVFSQKKLTKVLENAISLIETKYGKEISSGTWKEIKNTILVAAFSQLNPCNICENDSYWFVKRVKAKSISGFYCKKCKPKIDFQVFKSSTYRWRTLEFLQEKDND